MSGGTSIMKPATLIATAYLSLIPALGLVLPLFAAEPYRQISPADAVALLKADPKAILLDVRTPDEFITSRIPGSILIPDYELAARAAAELQDKNAQIVIYCRSGNRSRTAANRLLALGYTRVYDLGGIISWPYEKISGKVK
jgi:phage shock protein E